MDSEVKRDTSEFNSAISYLNRINTLFTIAAQSSISLDIYTWYHSLLALFRELSTEMKPNELAIKESEMDNLNNDMNSYLDEYRNSGNNETPSKLYKELHKFELSLRKVMKESGLQQKIMDDASKALR